MEDGRVDDVTLELFREMSGIVRKLTEVVQDLEMRLIAIETQAEDGATPDQEPAHD